MIVIGEWDEFPAHSHLEARLTLQLLSLLPFASNYTYSCTWEIYRCGYHLHIYLIATPHTGAVYLNDCPLQFRIPIWLIVFGCVSLAQTIVNVLKRFFRLFSKRDSDREEGQERNQAERGGSILETLFSLFLFIWIIIGSVWIFGNYSEFRDGRNDPNSPIYCQPVVYLFSFVTLVTIYVVSWLLCLCCCCLFCVVALAAGADSAWNATGEKSGKIVN